MHGVEIRNVRFVNFDSGSNLGKIIFIAGRKIIQSPNCFSPRQQRPRDGRSDKAANSRNQVESDA